MSHNSYIKHEEYVYDENGLIPEGLVPDEMLLESTDYRSGKSIWFKVIPVTTEYLKQVILPEMHMVVNSGFGCEEGFVFFHPICIIHNKEGIFFRVREHFYVKVPAGINFEKIYGGVVPGWYKLFPMHKGEIQGDKYILPNDLGKLKEHTDARLRDVYDSWKWNSGSFNAVCKVLEDSLKK